MAVNAEIARSGSESGLSVIRKFSRRVQGTGLIREVRGRRYYSRSTSKTVKKKQALRRITRRDQILKLVKEGKLTFEKGGRRRGPSRG
jgi:ribosomal protein S21